MNRPLKRTSAILQKVRSQRDPAAFQQLSSKMWLASKIAESIRSKGWTRTQFADTMQQTPSTITRWLSGKHNFTVDTLIAIEGVLGIDLLNRDRKKYEVDASMKGTLAPVAINIFITGNEYSHIAANGNLVMESILSEKSNIQIVKKRETALN